MTTDLFHIDYERLTEVLITIVVLSFLLERALSVIFENRLFILWTEGPPDGIGRQAGDKSKPKRNFKEVVASAVCISFCWWQDFDAISIILQSSDKATFWGVVITGLIIAGGSKASIGLFRDLLGFMSSAEKEREAAKKSKREAIKVNTLQTALK